MARSSARSSWRSTVDREKIAADYSKGVLTITLPKTAEAQKQEKKIEVKSA